MLTIPLTCPLCFATQVFSAGGNHGRDLYCCGTCQIIFVLPSQHLSSVEERHRYEQHNNDIHDPRYREFVSPLRDVIVEKLPAGALGLDFGAGTGPALSVMLEEKGFPMRQYDPFFWPDKQTLREKYDFIVASEVVEHFAHPREDFGLLRGLLKPGGILAIMTLFYSPEISLGDWYYLKDPTHVCAYRAETMEWISRHFDFQAWEVRPPRVALLWAR